MHQRETGNVQTSQYRDLPLAQLQESSTNPRKRFNEESLQELAASFRSQGILAPLVVRRLPSVEFPDRQSAEERFEVVAGARRFRAAKLAELATVPVRIVELTDAAALETQVVENLQREDIHPLEEALGFRSLLEVEATKYTVAEIAAKCGKSEGYVLNRIKLTELIPSVAEAFLADKIAIGHALLIAKLPASRQQEAFNASFRQMWTSEGNQQVLIPAKELAAWIQSSILLELSVAPFDRNDVTLVPQAGSCTDCPKRTGFNVMLFAEFAHHKDCCTDGDCFRTKLDTHVARTLEAKPKLVQISSAWGTGKNEGSPLGRNRYVEIEARAASKNVKAKRETAAEKKCPSTTEAIYMDGGHRGQIVKVCADLACRVHHVDKHEPSPEQLERQRAAERKRIEAQKVEITTRHQVLAGVLAKIASPLKQVDLQLVAMRLVEKLEYQRRMLVAKRHKLVAGRDSEADFQQVEKALRKLVKDADEAALCRLLMECALLDSAYSVAPDAGADPLASVARRYGVDTEKIAKSVREQYMAKRKKADEPKKGAKKKVGVA